MGLWKKGVSAITALKKQEASGDEDKKLNQDLPPDTPQEAGEKADVEIVALVSVPADPIQVEASPSAEACHVGLGFVPHSPKEL